jgi:hypothetical protein
MLSELLYGFESIGDNCEFGIVQRHHGIEPLGLLRWAGLKFDMLLSALDDGFAAMGRAENLKLRTLNTEYLVLDTSYGITYHPFVHIDRITPDELIARETVRIGFLRDKFLADLREARKILVFKQRDNLTEVAARDLLRRLAAYGPNKLLYVVATDDPRRWGAVDLVDDRLARGFVARFGDYKNLPQHICYTDWADICLQADTKLFTAPPGSPAATG